MARRALDKAELQERERKILRVARRLFLKRGIDGLTMDRIAADTDFSKGTVYQLFSSKEDVLAALCLESGRLRSSLLERAALFKGRSRERALAVAKADYIVYRLHPDYWKVEQLTDILSLTARISPSRRASLDAVIEHSAGIAVGIIRDGLACGELDLPRGLTAEKLLLALLGLTRGLYIMNSEQSLLRNWSADEPSTQEQILNCAFDGFGWSPFSKDWNYARTVQRVWREVFPKEAAGIGLVGNTPGMKP